MVDMFQSYAVAGDRWKLERQKRSTRIWIHEETSRLPLRRLIHSHTDYEFRHRLLQVIKPSLWRETMAANSRHNRVSQTYRQVVKEQQAALHNNNDRSYQTT